MFCSALLFVYPSFARILIGKREFVALLSLSSWCLSRDCCVAVPRVLKFVIVVFPDHTITISEYMNAKNKKYCSAFVFCFIHLKAID